jgi:lipopolysaccharide transport system permease protein
MNTKEKNGQWTQIIDSKRKLFELGLKDVAHYRDLILMFIKRDFIITYKQSVLGPLWYILQPLMSTVMYTFIFGNLAAIGTDGIPYILFYFAGSMLWTYFSNSLLSAANCFLDNKGVFDKVYFPRLCVPISTTVGHILRLLIQFACLLCFYIYYLIKGNAIHPSWMVVLFPLLLVWIGCLGTGIGLIISSLTTKYRDLKTLVQFSLPLLMYVTPVVYPMSQTPENLRLIFYFNPMSAPIEFFRIWFYGAGAVSTNMLIISIAETLVVLLLGVLLFNRNERNFVDVI